MRQFGGAAVRATDENVPQALSGYLSFPKIPSGLDWRDKAESPHYERRCLMSFTSTHSECSLLSCSSRAADLKPRICLSDIS
jgi:hypothetical protein